MSLVTLVVILILVGVALYVVNTLLPIDGKVKMLINLVVIVVLCLWVAQQMGWIGSIRGHDITLR